MHTIRTRFVLDREHARQPPFVWPLAALGSLALHCAGLLFLGLFLRGATEPSVYPSVLVLTLSALQSDGATSNAFTADGPLDPRAEAPRDVMPQAAQDGAHEERTRAIAANAERTDEPAPALPGDRDAGEPRARLDADAYAPNAADAGEPADVVAEIGSVAVEQEVVPASQPMSDRQKDMLSRRLRRWARSDARQQTGTIDSWTQKGQAYVATVSDEPASDDTGIDHRIVRISTQTADGTLSTEIRMHRLAFSHYAQFVDHWDPQVGLHDDELDGRFHSNSEIAFNLDRRAKPTFYGRVTTAAHGVNFGDKPGRASRDEIFRGGLETGIAPIHLPDRFVPFPHVEPRDDAIRYFNTDARVTFDSDGGYSWEDLAPGSGERHAIIAGDVAYLIAAAGVKLHVKGKVRNKVLVYSPEGIVVDDDLVYARDPRAGGDDPGDYLGLVSDKSVEVASQEITGPGDLNIDAAIYARREFVVRGYNASNDGALVVYGSLAAGSIAATEPRYRTRVRFDPRLETLRPPSFPLTDRYEVEEWDGVWRAENPR